MKRPTPASLKRVSPENLERLGVARLAEILVDVAAIRPELKRRLRMELAAEQGAEHLLPEIDRRLTRLMSTAGKVSWRQRPTFVRDLDVLRELIAVTLAELDAAAARDRILEFVALAGRAQARVRDKEGAVAAVFGRAAADLARLLGDLPLDEAGARLAAAIATAPGAWADWIVPALASGPQGLAAATLRYLPDKAGAGWAHVLRRLADAAGEADLFRATFSAEALKTPSVAAEVAQRYLQAGQTEAARAVLEAAVKPGLFQRARSGGLVTDFAWESVWIDYLEQSGQPEAAQAARWASFERTLSAERAKAFTSRLPDFEDVEAEHRAFALAADHADADLGLTLLMDWPAFPEAARMIAARSGDLNPSPEEAQAWAAKLRGRYPAAAHTVLRRAAAEAFRRREFANADRLTQEADTIAV